MKFLHLSDLHIGKNLNNYLMLEEQRNAFRQIIGYVKSERPAAVVIAGDVYDRAIPSVEAVRLFDDFLTELALENVAVLLISGNHDSPERIGYASRLLADKQLILYGAFDGELRRYTLADEFGDVNFWLLPFIRPLSVRGMYDEPEIESYDDAVSAAIGSAGVDYSARNVLISHQFFTKSGVVPVRSESELTPVGGLDAVDAGIIEKFDYAALGHLHGCQDVGAGHIRYSGSPVKYSFSECLHEKSVTLVMLGGKGDLSVRLLPITPIHEMRGIEGEIEELMDEAFVSLYDREDYLYVTLTDEEDLIDPMGRLRTVYPNVMGFNIKNSRTSIDLSEVSTDEAAVGKLSPYDLFCEFFLKTQGSTMSAEQDAIVRELMEGD